MTRVCGGHHGKVSALHCLSQPLFLVIGEIESHDVTPPSLVQFSRCAPLMVFKETILGFLASAHLTSEALNAFVLDCLSMDVCIADSQGRERDSVSFGAESKCAYCLFIKSWDTLISFLLLQWNC